MKSHRRSTDRPPFSRLVHLLLLVAWLLSSQGVVPALCLLAAVADGEHAVQVRATLSGDVSVVLSHDEKNAAASPHQHDPLCALVVIFAQKPAAGEVDHILAFKSVEDSSRTLRRSSMDTKLPALAAVPVSVVTCWLQSKSGGQSAPRIQAPAWSPGLHIKTSRTILRC
jgi:hypothetical protein